MKTLLKFGWCRKGVCGEGTVSSDRCQVAVEKVSFLSHRLNVILED